MRLTIAIVLIFLGTPAISQHDLSYFRSAFHNSQDDEALTAILETVPEVEDEEEEATIMAYKAVSETMKAEHRFSPITKLQLFNSGKTKLEAVIKAAPSPEVRYLRLLVQMNVPLILNYRSNIKEDLTYLAKTLKDADLSQKDKLMFKNTLANFTKEKEYLDIINNIVVY